MITPIPTLAGVENLGVDIPEIVEKVNELIEQSNRTERAVGILLHHHYKCVDQLTKKDLEYWEELTHQMGIRHPDRGVGHGS